MYSEPDALVAPPPSLAAGDPASCASTEVRRGRGLILLAGMPRSGTTWFGKVFDSHPDTLYRHEPDSVFGIPGVPLLAAPQDVEQYRQALADYAAALPSINLTKVASTLPVFPKRYYALWQVRARRAVVLAAKAAGRVLGELPVPEIAPRDRIERAVVVWKSIESVGRLGVLSRALPAARSILILRHPCGQIGSVLRGEAGGRFGGGTSSQEDYGVLEPLLRTPQAQRYALTRGDARRMPPLARLAWRWVLFNEKALDEIAGDDRSMSVRYEDVCADPAAQMRRLLAFGKLDWTEQTAAFVRQSTTAQNSAYYSVFKDPLGSASRWQHELPRADIEQIMSIVRESRLAALYPDGA